MRALLVFDLDETLFHTRHLPLQASPFWRQSWQQSISSSQLDQLSPDAILEDDYYRYACYKRPGLSDFLRKIQELPFDLAVWTSSTEEYAYHFIQRLFPVELVDKLVFIWTRNHCRIKKSLFTRRHQFIKDLNQIVAQYSYHLNQILIVDDSTDKLLFQPQNLLPIKPWTGNMGDRSLIELYHYLEKLPEQINFRQLPKKKWQKTY